MRKLSQSLILGFALAAIFLPPTKTFQHRGETWFEMMDSNQGPQRRLFLSSSELNTMLQENGVAYRPDPGNTPKLLRSKRDS